jgi:pyruvate formate lyase activating enzyme
MLGAQYGPEQLSKLLLRDLAYYRHSGGGVTLSGGECLIFPDYLLELLDALETSGIHVAVQTGGEFHYASAASVLERVALIQFDLKFANPELYRAHAGHGSVHVIDNLRRLLEHAAHKVEVRIPLIPEITTTDTNLRELAQLLQQLAVPKVTLLPFNPLGRNTLHALGRRVVAVSNQSLDPQAHAALISRFRTALSPCKCD